MTIGIAASGPGAGAGILAGLRAVEAIGRGAIGGFVTFAVLAETGEMHRAETQTGGVNALFSDEPPEALLQAPIAALISSGPNRPPPLSQFVAGAAGAGLVTGHRFPHLPAGDGTPLNKMVLAEMAAGRAPQAAIDAILARYPGHDAGFVAIDASGAIGLGDMPSVLRRQDRGSALQSLGAPARRVATIHNAIHPHRVLAEMVNDVVLDHMVRGDDVIGTIELCAGLDVRLAPVPEIQVNDASRAVAILHPEASSLAGTIAFGMGDAVRVTRRGEWLGWLGREPFMMVSNGTVVSLDGETRLELPVVAMP